MKCDEVQQSLPLFLYGELSFDQEEALELHIDECAACRQALAAEKLLHRAVNDIELLPAPGLLAECRQDLRRTLASADPPPRGFWARWGDLFQIRFHPTPVALQSLGALALLALGFFSARVVPSPFSPAVNTASLAEPVTSRVRYVEPESSGRVQIVVDETRQRVLSGDVRDQAIQRLLLSAAKDPSDAGLRVESVDLLKARSESGEVRAALLYALRHDPNPGVRLKALDGLKSFTEDPEARKTLTQVLLTDKNPGVRTQVIDLLIQHKTDNMVGVLQELMRTEDNGYVRMRCERALHDMNASVETF